MKFLFDIFPVVLFFAAFKVAGNHSEAASDLLLQHLGYSAAPSQAPILIATLVAIVATTAQVLWSWFRHRRVDNMLWVSFAIILVFGGATLWFHSETFIKWKPTVLYWLFGGVLLGSEFLFRKNLIRAMMERQLTLPDPVWQKLNLSWAAFFVLMGGINLYVAFNFPTDFWVNFKLFGGIGLMLVFVVAQGLMLSKYIEPEEKK